MRYDIEKLIFLIENRPPLFNWMLKDHNNRHLIDKLWDEVAKEMKCDAFSIGKLKLELYDVLVNECKTKWTGLRNSYARALRQEKYTKSESAGRPRKHWYLAGAMSFLKNYMKHQTSTDSNAKTESESVPIEDLSEESEPLPASPLSVINPPPPPKKQKLISVTEQGAEPTIEYIEARSSETEDINLTFFRSLLTDLKKLSNKKQRNFKRDVYNKLCDLVDQQEYENMGRQSTSAEYAMQNYATENKYNNE